MKVLVLLESVDACTSCHETFEREEQRAFDPVDNDHCPKCGDHGSLTTYYGNPEYELREHALGFDAVFSDGLLEFFEAAATDLVADALTIVCTICGAPPATPCRRLRGTARVFVGDRKTHIDRVAAGQTPGLDAAMRTRTWMVRP